MAEEEGAPELEEENFAEAVEVHAAVALIIGTEEGRLTETEVGVEDTKESTNDLRADDHSNKHGLLEKLTLCRVNSEGDGRVEHTTGNLSSHEDTDEEVESDGETSGGEVVTEDKHSRAEELIEANDEVVGVDTWLLDRIIHL